MQVTGIVRNGVVVLDGQPSLTEGRRVRVEPLPEAEALATLADRLKSVIGMAEGLPSDLAENHDHYLHGREKR